MHRLPRAVSGLVAITIAFFLVFLPAQIRPFAQGEVANQPSAQANDPLHPSETFSADASHRTLPEAFASRGVAFHSEDQINAFPDPSLGLGSIITVTRALPVTIQEGKRSHVYRTWTTNVGELLQEQRFELGQEDRINFTAATPLAAAMTINITRVARTVVTEVEKIAAKTVEKENNQAWRGEKTVTQPGKDGKREKKFLVIREDGELKSKTLQSNTIIEPVIDRIIEIGTKIKIGQTFTGKATYYENNWGTKVATDKFKRGVELRVTNLNNGKSIIVRNDGCICGATGVLIDLNPAYFKQLGGTLSQGVLGNIRVEEILN